MNDCLFCKISRKEIPGKMVYEDADLFAFEDIAPQAPTHILICPRKHLVTLGDAKARTPRCSRACFRWPRSSPSRGASPMAIARWSTTGPAPGSRCITCTCTCSAAAIFAGPRARVRDSSRRASQSWIVEVQAEPPDLNDVAIVQQRRAADGLAINLGDAVAQAQVITIVAFMDLRGHAGSEPSAQPHRGHFGPSDHRQFSGKHVLGLVGAPREHTQRGHAQACRRKLRAFAGNHGLPQQLAALLRVEHHGLVHFGRRRLAPRSSQGAPHRARHRLESGACRPEPGRHRAGWPAPRACRSQTCRSGC